MPKSEDIHTLYRRFGGNADSYQEIVSTDQALAAEQNWPMLGQLKTHTAGEAPPARRAVLVGGERREQVEVVVYKNAPQVEPQSAPQDALQSAPQVVPHPAPQVAAPVAPQPEPQASPSLRQMTAPVIAYVEPKPEKPVKRPRRAAPPAPVTAPPVAAPPAARKKRTAGSATSQVGLKGVFERMVPSDTGPAPSASPRGLKRLVKW